jgi:hypothetical protein
MHVTIWILTMLFGAHGAAPIAETTSPGFYGWVDPETGELDAPPVDAFAGELPEWQLEQALRTDGTDLLVEEDAFGMLSVDLQGRFQAATFALVRADGTVEYGHDRTLLDGIDGDLP